MCVMYAADACVLICKHNDFKNNGLLRKQKNVLNDEMVLAAQYGDDNIQDMLYMARDDNSKITRTTATTKTDSFYEKTENSSAPF